MERIKLKKLKSEYRFEKPVLYFMEADNSRFINLNQLIGSSMTLRFTGQIHCTHCDRKTKKSFGQGYCFPCFQRLARCDMCVFKPETCHYHAGTCREPRWGEEHCLNTHTVYLANSSGLKVGVTRGSQPMTRWIDQGAIQGIPLVTLNSRLDAGRVELALKEHIADKTNWRAMLKGEVARIDLVEARQNTLGLIPTNLDSQVSSQDMAEISYPVEIYPKTIKSLNLDKTPVIQGILQGIKGQYLIFDCGVINIRKFTGYLIYAEY